MIRKSFAALQNLLTSLPNPDPNISGQVESEKTGSDPHHWSQPNFKYKIEGATEKFKTIRGS